MAEKNERKKSDEIHRALAIHSACLYGLLYFYDRECGDEDIEFAVIETFNDLRDKCDPAAV